MISLYKPALQIGGGAVFVPSSQWQADRSHSGIQLTLWLSVWLLGALSTLTLLGFISWPVVFLSESGSGMICLLTSQSFSDGGIWNSPIRCLVERSCNAFCFPCTWCSCRVENYKSIGGPKRDRNDWFLLAHNFLLLVTTVCSAEFESTSPDALISTEFLVIHSIFTASLNSLIKTFHCLTCYLTTDSAATVTCK